MNLPNKLYITPETHWDREWYLPFQSYRMKLVLLMDQLLALLEKDPEYKNFTLDGQSVVLQDYLEVRPEKEPELRKYIKEERISVGPMYILPDEYLVSGESIIRNMMLGVKISRKFGKPMNCAYIPDPFGHIAQLPQIISGFDLPAVMFARGFGNEFEELKLDMEFIWDAPGNAASTIGVHLLEGYGCVAELTQEKSNDGQFLKAIERIEKVAEKLNNKSLSHIIPLNNGSDHLFAQPHISQVVEQWNKKYPKSIMKQTDFGIYAEQLIPFIGKMKHYSGELHGARYQHILSGVYSARMWIKQENMRIQTLLERFSEPAATLNWLLTKGKNYYPAGHLWTAWEALLKNHPHDSICGCSIDEVHDIDMKARFYNANVLAHEILKQNMYEICLCLELDDHRGERMPFVVFNSLPWDRTEIVKLKIYTDDIVDENSEESENFKVVDEAGKEYAFEINKITMPNNYTIMNTQPFELRFIAEKVPACGYKTYYLYPGEEPSVDDLDNAIATGDNWIENDFYRITIRPNGTFKILDKKTKRTFENLGLFEDSGDWGDEYDYSGPSPEQADTIISSIENTASFSIQNGPASARAEILMSLGIPVSLKYDKNRSARSDEIISNQFKLRIELPFKEPIIKLKIVWNNLCNDHRTRILFPTGIKANAVSADGHFYVVPRSITPPNDKNWLQKWQGTHHQNKFVSVTDEEGSFTVLNKGLPEYEARKEMDNSVTLAITLLRSIEWISRPDLYSRPGNAGPSIYTPGAQCIGEHTFELAITTSEDDWLEGNAYRISEQYVAPLQIIGPTSIGSMFRIIDAMPLYMGMMYKNISIEQKVKLPRELSFLKLTNPKITLTAFKKAEQEDALIIRLLNLSNTTQTDLISCYFPISHVAVVNYNEEPSKRPIKAQGTIKESKLSISLEPYVLATFKLSFK